MEQTKSQPKNLLNATKEERQAFFDSFDYLLSDCDGTIWDQNGPYEGAGEAAEALKAIGKRVVFVSNNATRSEQEYEERFKKHNFKLDVKHDLVTPATSIVDYLQSIDFKGLIYVLGSKVLIDYIKESGFDVVEEDPLAPIDDSLSALFTYAASPHKVSAVVFDYPVNLTFKQIVRAQMILADPEVKFIAGATEILIPLGKKLLGPGPFIQILEETNQRKADAVVGKPGKELTDILIKRLKIADPKRVVFVGDMPEQDVGFGNASGFQSLVVLFERTEEELFSITEPIKIANYYLPRFSDLKTILADLNPTN